MSARTKGKTSERELAIKLQTAAGRVTNPIFAKLATATGRVGHLVDLGFDILVGNGPTAIAGEAKRRKNFLSADALRALLQIDRIAGEQNLNPVLAFRLADDVETYHPEKLAGRKVRVTREWALAPIDYFCKAIAALRYLDASDQYGAFEDWWAFEQERAAEARRKAPKDQVQTEA